MRTVNHIQYIQHGSHKTILFTNHNSQNMFPVICKALPIVWKHRMRDPMDSHENKKLLDTQRSEVCSNPRNFAISVGFFDIKVTFCCNIFVTQKMTLSSSFPFIKRPTYSNVIRNIFIYYNLINEISVMKLRDV